MKTILIGILVLTFLTVGIVFLNDYFTKRKFRRFIEKKYQHIYPLKKKLDSNEQIDASEISDLLMIPSLRQAVYHLLMTYDRYDLFPSSYLSQAMGAESFLVTWLEYPTELGKPPDQIEMIEKVSLGEDPSAYYYVFKFRTTEPNWAARFNWMIGVTGPYTDKSLPYDVPHRVFSRFNKMNAISTEDEVRWVHNNINQG